MKSTLNLLLNGRVEKKQVVKIIDSLIPNKIIENECIEKYFEPFLGGGAVFFHLASKYDIKYAYLGDINKDLILTYYAVQKSPEKLIDELQILSDGFLPLSFDERKEYYYKVRDDYLYLLMKEKNIIIRFVMNLIILLKTLIR